MNDNYYRNLGIVPPSEQLVEEVRGLRKDVRGVCVLLFFIAMILGYLAVIVARAIVFWKGAV